MELAPQAPRRLFCATGNCTVPAIFTRASIFGPLRTGIGEPAGSVCGKGHRRVAARAGEAGRSAMRQGWTRSFATRRAPGSCSDGATYRWWISATRCQGIRLLRLGRVWELHDERQVRAGWEEIEGLAICCRSPSGTSAGVPAAEERPEPVSTTCLHFCEIETMNLSGRIQEEPALVSEVTRSICLPLPGAAGTIGKSSLWRRGYQGVRAARLHGRNGEESRHHKR